jgi:hypothetical protein
MTERLARFAPGLTELLSYSFGENFRHDLSAGVSVAAVASALKFRVFDIPMSLRVKRRHCTVIGACRLGARSHRSAHYKGSGPNFVWSILPNGLKRKRTRTGLPLQP